MSERRENGKEEIGKEIKRRQGWNKEEKRNQQFVGEPKEKIIKGKERRNKRVRGERKKENKKKGKKQSCPNFFTISSPRIKVGILDESYE